MSGLLALTRSEIKLFLRDPFSVIFALAFPLMMMLLLSGVFGNDPADAQEVENGRLVWRGVTPTNYYTAGSVGVIVAALGVMSLPIQLTGYREQGILRRMRASSIPAWALFASQLALSLLVVLAGAGLMAVISWLLYDASLPEDVPGVLFAVLLGTVAFSGIGALLAALLSTARAAQGIGLMLFFTIWLLAGTGPPRAVLPEGVRALSDYLPLTYLVTAIQDPWFGYGWNVSDLAVLAAIAAVTTAFAMWRFRWD